MLDPARQIAAMDERGVDVHLLPAILAVTPTGWASPEVALDLSRRYNDALAELARADDELGLHVVQLPANVGGVYLGEPLFRPLWEEIAQRGVLVFIHPDGVRDPWFQKYSLWNSVGQPIEEARVLASLIYGACTSPRR